MHTNVLIQLMQKCGRLPPIKINEAAMRACKQNTERIVALNEPSPTIGGNLVAYNTMTGKVEVGKEFTHF